MLLAVAREFLASQPGVARVWTRSEIEAGGGPADRSHLYRNSLARGRGGDLIIEPARDCLLAPLDFGTSHGSPHGYDRDVPLLFWGSAITAGRTSGPASPVDVAPTLAAELGVAIPAGLDGRVLPLHD